MTVLLYLLSLLLFALSAYGWGAVACRLLHRGADLGWAYATTLGLAVLVFLGGILNAVHLAFAPALWGLLAVGWALWAVRAVRAVRWVRDPGRRLPGVTDLLAALPVAVVGVFLAASLMPAAAFNLHDDFHTYFLRPVRMLATGTVGGAPMDVLGLDSLGGQSLFHAFALLVFPVTYLQAPDAVFGAALGLALAIAFARRAGAAPWAWGLAVAAYLLVDPQRVNVSTVYLGVALIVALAMAAHRAAEALTGVGGDARATSDGTRDGIAAGLLLGTLVGLKVTFAPFCAVFALTCAAALLAAGVPRARVGRLTLVAAGAAVAAVLPWLAVHLPHYWAALGAAPGLPELGGAPETVLPRGRVTDLWSTGDLFWGGSFLAYNVLVGALAAAAVAAAVAVRARGAGGATAVVALGAAAAGVAVYVIDGMLFEAQTAVRYAAPVLVAVAPIALALLGVLGAPRGRIAPAAAVAATLALAVLFGPALGRRVYRIGVLHSGVSLPVDADYLKYMAFALGDRARAGVRAAQDAVPAGAPLMAYIAEPFWLDLRRNPVTTVAEPGLANPWVDLPERGGADAFVKWLHGQGIRYLMVQYTGPAVKGTREFIDALGSAHPHYRKIARRNLAFRRAVEALALRVPTVYRAGDLAVLDTGPPPVGG